MRMVLMAFFMALATPALAQNCATSIQVISLLTQRYDESVIDSLVREDHDGHEVNWNLWVSDATGTWTLTGTVGSITCIFSFGEGYEGATISSLVAEVLDGSAA